MFKSFREKLAGIFKLSEKPKQKEKPAKKPKKSEKPDKVEKKLEKEIKKIDKGEIKEIPLKKEFSVARAKYEPKPQTAEELVEENKEELEELIEEVEEKLEEEPVEEQSFFTRIKRKFTTAQLTQEIFDEFFEGLEMLLLENNVALQVVDKIRKSMEEKLVNIEIKKQEIEQEIKTSLKEAIQNVLIEPFDLITKINEKQDTYVILFFGINGSGKTTTIAKIANLLKENKIPTVLAAGDTFRAASIEQLKKHGEKLGIKVIHQDYGSDPAAVGFDAIKYAKAHKIKVVLIDTAGRMHTQKNLLNEMEKVVRITKPDLKIFVAESITGNDAIEQAKNFQEAFGIDASILTKADVDEKGGTAISIGHITNKPIIFLGTGQEYKNLEKFSPEEILIGLGLD